MLQTARHGGFLCTEKTFDLLKHPAVWQLQVSDKKSKGRGQWGRTPNGTVNITSFLRQYTEDRYSTERGVEQ